jgi:predicted O-linked N-acetylglucosamine transferase (SPINDLY family)
LAHHDRSQFTAICYSDVDRPDAVTRRLREAAGGWRDVVGIPHEAVADLVRRDGIDILVDLAGHMPRNRLLLFARKPAPVQVTYLGYPDTTGLATMDYKITDDLHDPPGATDRYYTERLIRIPGGCWCYRPNEDSPDVVVPPCLEAGRVTFAALNRLVKATPKVMRLWAQILKAVPGSRLIASAGSHDRVDASVQELFERNGITKDRVVLDGRKRHAQYLARFNEADIALDTFPYSGQTTTCDASWMGVPTVTLAGRTHVSRGGVSLLTSVGLRECIADTPQAYVDTAVRLATDPGHLREMRATLRERMRRSLLCDGLAQARKLEQAYRFAWQQWCAAPATQDDARRATAAPGECGTA